MGNLVGFQLLLPTIRGHLTRKDGRPQTWLEMRRPRYTEVTIEAVEVGAPAPTDVVTTSITKPPHPVNCRENRVGPKIRIF